jgi:hypothetical protein
MTTIYYLFGIFFIWTELTWLMSPIEKTRNTEKFMELSKLNKGKKWDDYSDEYKSELKSKIGKVLVLLWLFVGLLTFQWVGFLAVILFNIVVMAPLSALTKYSMAYTVLHWFNSLIGFAFGIFVIINHYHLKIDLANWLLY